MSSTSIFFLGKYLSYPSFSSGKVGRILSDTVTIPDPCRVESENTGWTYWNWRWLRTKTRDFCLCIWSMQILGIAWACRCWASLLTHGSGMFRLGMMLTFLVQGCRRTDNYFQAKWTLFLPENHVFGLPGKRSLQFTAKNLTSEDWLAFFS